VSVCVRVCVVCESERRDNKRAWVCESDREISVHVCV